MTDPEQRAAQGLLHLQGAAVQLIAAARAFLDVAEELVQDPAAGAGVVQAMSALATSVRSEWARSEWNGSPLRVDHEGTTTPAGGEGPSRVTRITLSDEG